MDGFNLPSTVTLTMLALQGVDKHWENLPILQHCAQCHTWVGGGKLKPRKKLV